MTRQPLFNWVVGLGRWWGTAVEVHLLVLLAAVAILMATPAVPHLGFVLVGVGLASLAIHELAHIAVASRLGGSYDRIVIGPAGGLTGPTIADDPEPQVLVALAGPTSHLCLVIAAMSGLVFQGASEVLSLLNPVTAWGEFVATDPIGLSIVKATLAINWLLFLLNTLPAYPFDGATAIRSLLWPMVGRRTAHVVTSRVAQAIAGALLFCGMYVATLLQGSSTAWGAMLMLSLFLAVSAQRDLQHMSLLDFESMDDTLPTLDLDDEDEDDWLREDPSQMVLVEQHYDQLRERYERKRKAQEDYEDARVDDILARLHHDGIDHISQEDQAFLKRASRRYRDRRRDRQLDSGEFGEA